MLNLLGLRDIAIMAFLWYYMNILIIAGIIYMLLKLAIVRAKRATINRAETTSKSDMLLIRFSIFVAIFGIVLFMLREYTKELQAFWHWANEGIQEVKNG